jgi:hypothetical protein
VYVSSLGETGISFVRSKRDVIVRLLMLAITLDIKLVVWAYGTTHHGLLDLIYRD